MGVPDRHYNDITCSSNFLRVWSIAVAHCHFGALFLQKLRGWRPDKRGAPEHGHLLTANQNAVKREKLRDPARRRRDVRARFAKPVNIFSRENRVLNARLIMRGRERKLYDDAVYRGIRVQTRDLREKDFSRHVFLKLLVKHRSAD